MYNHNTANVYLWGTHVGTVLLTDESPIAKFQYTDSFRDMGIEISPLRMPLAATVFEFPDLPVKSFHGLPGLVSDSLPDKFGNKVITAWLREQGRRPEGFLFFSLSFPVICRRIETTVPLPGEDSMSNLPLCREMDTLASFATVSADLRIAVEKSGSSSASLLRSHRQRRSSVRHEPSILVAAARWRVNASGSTVRERSAA